MKREIFEVFEATLVVDFSEENLKAGDAVYGSVGPDGTVSLSDAGTVGTRHLGAVFHSEPGSDVGKTYQVNDPHLLEQLQGPSDFERDPGLPGLFVLRKP